MGGDVIVQFERVTVCSEHPHPAGMGCVASKNGPITGFEPFGIGAAKMDL